jgi:hypothetical protein
MLSKSCDACRMSEQKGNLMTTQPQPYPPREAVRVPLTAGQHILHLILTMLTFGLWSPVWIWRAVAGNKVWADTQPGYYRPPPPPYQWQPPRQ